jgi:hypothetical protein
MKFEDFFMFCCNLFTFHGLYSINFKIYSMKKSLSLLVIALTFSCNSADEAINPVTQEPVDVYVGGQKNNQACYWKNNQAFFLENGLNSSADTLFVANNDVHVLGKRYADNWIPDYLYWKNNVLTNLNDALTTPDQIVRSITGMDVVGTDVYFVGYTKTPFIAAEMYDLAYWKNGEKTVVASGLNNPTVSSKIKVLNNSVYVMAQTSDCFDTCYGVYVDGVFQAVPIGVQLKDLATNNSEVYVYGTNFTTNNGYYKNITTGVETSSTTISSVENFKFDMGNLYYSTLFAIYKNATVVYGAPQNDILITFKVLENNMYVIEGSNSQTLKINDVISMTTAEDERFTSLFVE